VAVAIAAYGDWVNDGTADLYTLMRGSLDDLRQAVVGTRGADSQRETEGANKPIQE
jgi:hypothetical protein